MIVLAVFLASGCGVTKTANYAGTARTVAFSESSQDAAAQESESSQDVVAQESTSTATQTMAVPEITVQYGSEYGVTLKRDILVIMLAYPNDVAGVETKDSKTYLVMKSGNLIRYDDEKKKSFDEKINDADIQDMLETLYPLGEIDAIMDKDFDPGRMRVYRFFDEIYGASKKAVSVQLTSVKFGDQHLPFNQAAGASVALEKVASQAAELVERNPLAASFLYPSSGTFNYRVVAGTSLLSFHAYGIAIDLKSNENDYWRWASQPAGESRIREYPKELVKVFENNGFIWGGKWQHFDLLHYEYRPEILLKAKFFPSQPDLNKPWFDGADLQDEKVRQCIARIDSILE